MNKYSVEIKWAFIFGVAYLIWMLLEKSLGYHSIKAVQEPIFNLLFTLISFVIYFLALKEKKTKIYQNEMEWKHGFASGIVLSFFTTIITTTVVFITFSLISPTFLKTLLN